MSEVPISWVTYCADNPARGRWDQAHLTRIIEREEWLVPGGFTFVDTPWTPDDGKGRVIIFPCGHYHDHEERHRVLDAFQRDIRKLEWSLIIATSDEGSTFEWNKFTLPERSRLWVMTPRPEDVYPRGTFFIGEGCPWPSRHVARPAADADWPKDIDIYFAGQINHEGREQMVAAVHDLMESRDDLTILMRPTDGFAEGVSRAVYVAEMCATRIALCPAGAMTQDSFRLFEALEAQSIPVVDIFRSDGKGPGYWQMLFRDPPLREIAVWARFDKIDWPLDYPKEQARVSAWWQQYKRSLAYRLHRDVHDLTVGFYFPSHHGHANDDVTVIIPTSPTPSNPDISMIVDTIESVRRHLPTAEIFITIDGVRHEQAGGREADYWEYARRLVAWTNTQQNIVPFVHTEHLHQSGMMHHALAQVTTSMVLYVEHDTPLVGEIDFDECVEMMWEHKLNLLRFSHEAFILEEHDHLFLERTPVKGDYVRTIQWSQRPHLAVADWYRQVMDEHFGVEARTMIEDVMHGVVQHKVFTDRIRLREAWDKWRLAVYAPPGNIKRSEHSDGRGADPKFGMFIAYDGDIPPGAPQPGWM